MTAHTPGPWHLHADGITILSNQSHPVAALSDPRHRQVGDERGRVYIGNDGPLIAAAPELLAAVVELIRGIVEDEWGEGRCGDALSRARAAIVKAHGGTP